MTTTEKEVILIRSKGDLMRAVYTNEELRNIDSAIPIQYWKTLDTAIHVMNYNEPNRVFGKLENMEEVAVQRDIHIKWHNRNR